MQTFANKSFVGNGLQGKVVRSQSRAKSVIKAVAASAQTKLNTKRSEEVGLKLMRCDI